MPPCFPADLLLYAGLVVHKVFIVHKVCYTLFVNWPLVRIVNEIAFFVLLWMTVETFFWAMRFIETTDKTGAEVGLMVAAVTVPIGYLQKAIVELYNEARK